MGNGFGGLLGGLLGIAILATVAGSIMSKGANTIWGGMKEASHKVPKGEVKFW